MSANDEQVGGTHYQPDEGMRERAALLGVEVQQHWDFVFTHGYNYLQGNASKYLDRYDKKGTPVQDLQKARQYIDKLIEIEVAKEAAAAVSNAPARPSRRQH